MKKRVVLSWSSGKDSAWALHTLRADPDLEVTGLLTTTNSAFDRVAMHGTRLELLRQQAEAVGLPLIEVPLPWPCSNDQYEDVMRLCVQQMKAARTDAVAFGDLFLEDVRAYRERQLAGTGLEPLFPLWGRPTSDLACEMLDGGLDARITCLNPAVMPREFAGRRFADVMASLPDGVDPCGERGEFHTCVTAGPMFAAPLDVETGEVVERDGFVFADLSLKSPA